MEETVGRLESFFTAFLFSNFFPSSSSKVLIVGYGLWVVLLYRAFIFQRIVFRVRSLIDERLCIFL